MVFPSQEDPLGSTYGLMWQDGLKRVLTGTLVPAHKEAHHMSLPLLGKISTVKVVLLIHMPVGWPGKTHSGMDLAVSTLATSAVTTANMDGFILKTIQPMTILKLDGVITGSLQLRIRWSTFWKFGFCSMQVAFLSYKGRHQH
jgi:hypothetical protein